MASGDHSTAKLARGFIKLTGPDVRSWLQGLVSNDVDQVSSTKTAHAAMLNPQGKFLFHMFIWPQADGLILETSPERVAALIQRLTMYKLRAAVDLSDVSDDFEIHLIWGDGLLAAVNLPTEAGAAVIADDVIITVDPRLAALGLRVLAPKGADIDVSVSATQADIQQYRAHQARLGVFDPDGDLRPEKTTLLEANFDFLGGVDFNKGCYVGQEVTARMHYRGLARKRYWIVESPGADLKPGDVVTSGDKEAGEIMSGQDGVGLALIRTDRLTDGVQPTINGAPVTVTRPGYLASS